ncbi:copper chaperone PCu(A)C [Deinococcus sp. HMF7620]|uniref:Copper chaperone PCu(A)C n=1 Tax=Deinococcus arboris TaxID=2682977 RepID=A0A7C9LTD4_9DEIO|nr:copper chaperone PCu(A)C [Deinococcus arboris]MVN86540.1 copper chaperone PCu(A)C [Deinococcus arboris]
MTRSMLLGAALLALVACRPAPQTAGHPAGHTGHRQSEAGTPSSVLSVHDARVVAVPPSVGDTSVFGTLHNAGPAPLRLVGVQTDVASHGMLMVTQTSAAGLTGMQDTPALTVPAGGDLTLSDTGDHLMLMGLRAPLQEGQTLTLTLTDDAGGTHTFDAPVVKP